VTCDRWYVQPPKSFETMASQAARSMLAAREHRPRLVIESAAAELDPTTPAYKQQELVSFAIDVATPLLERGDLPKSKPHVKLLFSNQMDATLAGASVMNTGLPVSMLGHPSAIGPRDGAFVVVAPTSSPDIDTERALNDLVQAAGVRTVVVVNPRLGNAPVLQTFEPAYMMRPLSVGFMRNQLAKQVERVPACLLRCYPHEWSLLFAASKERASWRYAGRFERQPRVEEVEKVLQRAINEARDEGVLEQS